MYTVNSTTSTVVVGRSASANAAAGRSAASKAEGQVNATFAVAATGGGALMAGAAPVLTAEEFELSEVVTQMTQASSVNVRISAPTISVGSLLAGLDLEQHALEDDAEKGTAAAAAISSVAQAVVDQASDLFAPRHTHKLAAGSLVEQQANAVSADATETGSLNRLKSLAVDEASLEHAIADLTQEEAEVLLNAIHRRWERTVTEEAEAVIEAVTRSSDSTSAADSTSTSHSNGPSLTTYISSGVSTGVDSFSSWFAAAQAQMTAAHQASPAPPAAEDRAQTQSRTWAEYAQSFIYTADQRECAAA